MSGGSDEPEQGLPAAPDGRVLRADVVYGTAGAGGRELRLHLYAGEPGRREPGILLFHGGGWQQGSPLMLAGIAAGLAARGYVTATAGYRFVHEQPWPAPVEDAACAVRWMRVHADDIGVDPDRIAVAGGSAGGQLAALVAYAPGRFDGTGGWADVPSEAQAAVLYNPAVDLRGADPADGTRSLLSHAFGESDPAVLAEASPVVHVTAQAPPTLTLVGDSDQVTPASDAVELHLRLDAFDVPNQLEIIPGADHGLPAQDPETCLRSTIRFLDGIWPHR